MKIENETPLFSPAGLAGLLEVEAVEPGFIDSLILEYEKNYDEIITETEKAFRTQDFVNAEMTVHSLKSSSAVLGLAQAASICARMEDDAHNLLVTKLEFQQLRNAIQQALVELKKFDKAA